MQIPDRINEQFSVAIIDDEATIVDSIADFLKETGLRISPFTDPEKALEYLKNNPVDIVIVDYKMPKWNGIDFLIEAKKSNLYIYCILLTAFADKNILEKAINNSLIHKLYEKPLKLKDFKFYVNEAIDFCDRIKRRNLKLIELEKKYDRLQQHLENDYNEIIGLNSGLKEIFEKIKLISKHEISCLIIGESGTGKEAIAKLIHDLSPRCNNDFIVIDCTTIPKDLLESELFGHVRGAFTGADKDKIGKIELSNHGTLFLDEIGDLHVELQAKLLRVLQEKKITRIGSTQEITVDFLLICATNKNLELAIQGNLFRSELYFRINQYNLYLPALRERGKDIIDLTYYFFKKHCKRLKLQGKEIDDNIFDVLSNYSWPGNIRELENAVVRVLISTYYKNIIQKEDFLFLLNTNQSNQSYDPIKALGNDLIHKNKNMKDIEVMLLKYILDYFDGNIADASKLTGISKNKFYRYVK
jgi:DNA-binding NtrC family response regulator